jgi:hypothetical protein
MSSTADEIVSPDLFSDDNSQLFRASSVASTASSSFTTDDHSDQSPPEPIAIYDAAAAIDPVAAVAVPLIFSLIFVVGLVGNSLQVFTVVGNASMRRSPPNILIAGLGVGDLLLLLVSVPFAATFYTLPEWPFGTVVCKLYTGAYSASLTVSVMTLTALSADRYIAIVHPLTAIRVSTLRRSLIVTACIWTAAVGLASIELVAADVRPEEFLNIAICSAFPHDWPEWYEYFVPTFRFAAMFVGPLIAIGVFYACIAGVLMKSRIHDDEIDGPVSTPVVVAKLLDRQDRERKRVAKVMTFSSLCMSMFLSMQLTNGWTNGSLT